MNHDNHKKCRDVLRENPDGLTVAQIHKITGVLHSAIRYALKAMPDTYIDRWVPSENGYASVWCVVDVPEDCPRPKNRGKK